MARFDPPPKFTFKANDWECWIQDYGRFRIASKIHREEGEVQRDTLLYCMGSKQAEEVMQTFKWEKKRIPNPENAEETIEVDEMDTDYDVLAKKIH